MRARRVRSAGIEPRIQEAAAAYGAARERVADTPVAWPELRALAAELEQLRKKRSAVRWR
ncbi:MAG: hypothetical protein AMXMBFR8_26870 [Nevskiales bacterium]